MNRYERILEIIFKNTEPHIHVYREPWKILISTILSQRARDDQTAKISEKLYERYGTLEELKNADINELMETIRGIGFYRAKAKHIKDIAGILIDNYNGRVPDEREDLLRLPGVGSKTANIVLSVCYGKDYIAVDTHVHRVMNRIGIVKTRNPEETERALMEIIDRKYWKKINEYLVEFGKNICRPISPRCDICPVSEYCNYYRGKIKRCS
ncbi:MAG: endonuclease III [Thermoplasmata archaeon]